MLKTAENLKFYWINSALIPGLTQTEANVFPWRVSGFLFDIIRTIMINIEHVSIKSWWSLGGWTGEQLFQILVPDTAELREGSGLAPASLRPGLEPSSAVADPQGYSQRSGASGSCRGGFGIMTFDAFSVKVCILRRWKKVPTKTFWWCRRSR